MVAAECCMLTDWPVIVCIQFHLASYMNGGFVWLRNNLALSYIQLTEQLASAHS